MHFFVLYCVEFMGKRLWHLPHAKLSFSGRHTAEVAIGTVQGPQHIDD